MSRNRENAVWQSKDKTWSIGFYSVSSGSNRNDPDYDDEWDVDYDFGSFEFASVGHPTEQAARAAWRGANPGGTSVLHYSTANAKEIAELERMALFFLHPELAAAAAKKEAAKAKREHVKKLKELFTENKDYKGCNVTVVIKKDNEPWTRLGISQSQTGYMHTEGDWLVVEGVKVKNIKTGRLNPKLHEVKLSRTPNFYGRIY